MKKILTSLLMYIVCSSLLTAQTTDENGAKNYTANVAVFVNETMYEIENGSIHRAEIEGRERLKDALTLYMSQYFMQNGFLIVNSDPAINQKINSIVQENKLEEYIDGMSIQAKNVGAQFLALLDYTLYMEKNTDITVDFAFRFINVYTGVSTHRHVTRTNVCYTANDVNKLSVDAFKDFTVEFDDFFKHQFIPSFVVSEVNGKKTKLFATRAMQLTNDNVDFYKWYNEVHKFNGKEIKFCCLDYLTTSSTPLSKAKVDMNTQAIMLNTKKAISENPQSLTAASGVKWFIVGESHSPVIYTYLELPYTENSKEAFARKMVNNAVYQAISTHPNQNLIAESEMNPEIKAERERQKSEDFMNTENNNYQNLIDKLGSGAMGAQYLISIEDFKLDSNDIKKVSFTLKCYGTEENILHKAHNVSCHLSNINEVMDYYINQYLLTLVSVSSFDNKYISLVTTMWLKANVGDIFVLNGIMEIIDPLTGKTVYKRTPIAEYKYIEWKGQKHVLELKTVLNKEMYKNMTELCEKERNGKGNFTLLKQVNKPDKMDRDNSIFAKKEKANNVLDAFSGGFSF